MCEIQMAIDCKGCIVNSDNVLYTAQQMCHAFKKSVAAFFATF